MNNIPLHKLRKEKEVIETIEANGSTITITTDWLSNPKNIHARMAIKCISIPQPLAGAIVRINILKDYKTSWTHHDTDDIVNRTLQYAFVANVFKLGFTFIRDDLPVNYITLMSRIRVKYISEG